MCLKTDLYGLVFKTVWENGQKTSYIAIFTFFLYSKIPWKMRSQKAKLSFHNFLGNICAHIQNKLRKGWMKTEGAYSIWKKDVGRTDGRTDGRRTAQRRISSADYVSSGAKNTFRGNL